MAGLGLSNQEIERNIAMVMGIHRDSEEWSSTTRADVDRIIRAGRRKFQSAYDWSFLRELVTISILAPYTTGTVTIASGVVTLAGGTWPSTAADQKLAVDGAVYEVATRTSNSVIVLSDTSVTAAAGTTYSLYTTRYALPSNFASFHTPPTVEGVSAYEIYESAVLPEYEVRRLGSIRTPYASRPSLFSVHQELDTSAEFGVPTYYLDIYPLPDRAYVMRAVVGKNIGDALAADPTTEIFHASFSELLQLAILSAAEKMYNNEAGIHTQDYERSLPDYVRKDQKAAGARRLLPRPDSGGGRGNGYPNYELAVAPVIIE